MHVRAFLELAKRLGGILLCPRCLTLKHRGPCPYDAASVPLRLFAPLRFHGWQKVGRLYLPSEIAT